MKLASSGVTHLPPAHFLLTFEITLLYHFLCA